MVSSILLNGSYEPETTHVIEAVLRQGMSFVDVGAHIGYFTLLAARAVGPEGRVYAFEPVEATCQMLRQNLAVNDLAGRVIVVRQAVADGRRRVRLHISQPQSVSSYIEDDPCLSGSSEEVDTLSLDEFFGSLGWPPVHFVKLDVEGSEMAALRGMRELVNRNPNLKLVFEYHAAHLGRRRVSPEQLFELLQGHGFRRFRILWREGGVLDVPREIPRLVDLGKRANLNILAES
ncbi:MAG: FkbM family methyltransferase [Acidobacteria bacterium]|nr:FkbM family methyltransferase [Acidobacteriota bacterium]